MTKSQAILKRMLDVLGALILLILLAPILCPIILLIVLDSKGGPLYADKRVGKNGKAFMMYKFRSMVVGASEVGVGHRMTPGDQRITRIGKILRRFSLDELPQLINVLTGNMSLVGPRPGLPGQAAEYTERQKARLQVKPGMTGLAQVSGRNLLSWSERIERDLWYIERYSSWLDLKILALTVPTVLLGIGLYSKHQEQDFS